MDKITKLINTGKTVFRYEKIQALFFDIEKGSLSKYLSRSKKSGKLKNPIKGIWTLPVYDEKELACKLRKNSYISLETVLYDFGCIFQAYFKSITCISDKGLSYEFEGKTYKYSQTKNKIFLDEMGIRDYGNYRIAMPERALCDYVYLHPNPNIDAPEVFLNNTSLIRLSKFVSIYPKQTKKNILKILGIASF